MKRSFTVLLEKEGDMYTSLCPELDIASQGETIEEAKENLREAVELFLETASPGEIQERTANEIYIGRMEVSIGQAG